MHQFQLKLLLRRFDIGLFDLPKPGWAIARPAHQSPTPLMLKSFKKLPEDGIVEVVEGVPEAFLFLEAEIETD